VTTRNQLLAELHRRIWQVAGINAVIRNPKRVPDDLDFPIGGIFPATDSIIKMDTAGGLPVLIREMPVRIELFIDGASDETAPEEIEALLLLAKKEVYRGGPPWWGGLAMLVTEGATSNLLVPETDNVLGIAVEFTITYKESIADLFA